MVTRRTRFNAVVWGNTGMVVRASTGPDRKGSGTQVLTHPTPRGLFVWRTSSSLFARLAASSNKLPLRSLGTPLLSSFIAFRHPRLSLRDAGETRWDVLMKFLAVTLQSSGIMII